jgi:hypothetical protein
MDQRYSQKRAMLGDWVLVLVQRREEELREERRRTTSHEWACLCGCKISGTSDAKMHKKISCRVVDLRRAVRAARGGRRSVGVKVKVMVEKRRWGGLLEHKG